MKILVTGASGFLNHHLRQEFAQYPEHEVVFAGHQACNLLHLDRIKVFFDQHVRKLDQEPFDAILHTAAKCGGIGANANNPATFLTENLHMGLNIYEAARIYGVKKVYSLGSVCSYPIHCPIPFKEDDLFAGTPEPTNWPYGHAKRTLFLLSQTYRQQFGLGGAFLVPVNLFGTHDHFDLVNSHVIPALINKFVTAQQQHLPEVHCWGTGVATREFLYAGDAAQAIVKAVVTQLDYDKPINLGTGKDISIKDLAELIADLVDYQGRIVFTGEVSDGQPKRLLNVSRAKEVLHWQAQTSLTEGLIKSIAWFRDSINQNKLL